MSFLFGNQEEEIQDQLQKSEQKVNAEMVKTQAELEQKKQGLYDTRLGIIKGQGGEAWS